MLFNSLEFAIFFAIVYGLYLVLPHQWQNKLLLAAGFIFYSSWDWRFFSLIILLICIGYFCGMKIDGSKEAKTKKLFLSLSVVSSLAILGFFKYFNFFVSNLAGLLKAFGAPVEYHALNIILPMGISFYIFKTLTYPIDIYRGKMKPTKNILDFALYVSFFLQLIAGPIQRAKDLLPQITAPRRIGLNDFYEGCSLIFWGLFLKIFVADNLSKVVAPVFALNSSCSGAEILLASYAFTFQLFCDFEGYSSMARGLGRVMGFDIMLNFNLPFFAVNIQDFWNRWHISLSTWIRDYLYTPLFDALSFIRGNPRIYITLLVSMSLMGLWHGAEWTFLFFGLYHGALLVIYIILRSRFHIKRYIQPKSVFGQQLWVWVRIFFMFQLIAFGMMIFRAQSASHLFFLLHRLIFQFNGGAPKALLFQFLAFACPVFIIQFGQYKTGDLMFIYHRHWLVKTVIYAIMLHLILGWGVMSTEEFIYFQF